MLYHRGALVLTGPALALGAPAAGEAVAQAPAYLTSPIAAPAEPMLHVGGLRINPRTNGPHRNAAVARGYAITGNPTIPTVGTGETANDTYVEPLAAGAAAQRLSRMPRPGLDARPPAHPRSRRHA